MTPAMWAILLRPIANAIIFFTIIAPIAWLLYQLFPEGRLKMFLFKIRTGPHAARRDKWIMAIAVIVAYAAFIGWSAVLSRV